MSERPRSRWQRLTSCLLCCLLLPTVLHAAPRDDVLRLVPEDVGFCLLLQDLRGHAAAVRESPFAKQFMQSRFGVALRTAPEMGKLGDAEKFLKEYLQVEGIQLWDEIFGDAVALAYRPGPPGKPEQEQNLLVLKARDAALLARLVGRINELQKSGGELKELQEREHKGAKYFRRVKAGEGGEFYLLRGPLFVFTGQEAMLQRVIDLDQQAPPAEKSAPPLARRLQQLGADKALAALWLNPRAFEPELHQKLRQAQGGEAAFLKTFATYWKALDDFAVFLSPHKDLELGVSVRARADELPPAFRKFLAEAGKRSELWSSFPEDALLALAGRLDATALVDFLSEFLPEEARKEITEHVEQGAGATLGRDVRKEVLPLLGPDAGVCVLAPDPADKGWFPQTVCAVRVRSDGKSPAVDQSLVTTLNSFAILAVLDHNNKHPAKLSLKSTMQGKVEVKSLVHEKFPPGFQPSFALKDGYLLLASSPEAIGRFKVGAGEPAPAAGETPILRMSLRTLRTFLKEKREPLLAYQAEKNPQAREDAGRQLENLLEALQFVDRLELTQKAEANQVTLRLRLQPAQPLQK